MKILKNNFEKYKREVLDLIEKGGVIIYPTDTIYGIGCDATNDLAVKKIREIKNREIKPFSVIAPNKKWIMDNCETGDGKDLERLPGPYTLIYKTKNKAVSDQINPEAKTLGVRIPKHWFSKWIEALGKPFVTTSVNISGEKHMEVLSDLKKEVLDSVDLVLYEGEIHGQSSTKIDLSER